MNPSIQNRSNANLEVSEAAARPGWLLVRLWGAGLGAPIRGLWGHLGGVPFPAFPVRHIIKIKNFGRGA